MNHNEGQKLKIEHFFVLNSCILHFMWAKHIYKLDDVYKILPPSVQKLINMLYTSSRVIM